eukprot:4940672-Pyramimonas_sp.AAC.1
MQNFVDVCGQCKIPLNVGKSLVRGLRASILGGEVDGARGRLVHSRTKGHKVVCKTVALLTTDEWSQAAMQHWC